MPDLPVLYNRYKKYLLFMLAVMVLGWGFAPYKPVFAGLILGTGVSFFNLQQLVKKTIRISEAVTDGKNAYSLGTFSRMAFAVLAVLISFYFPEYFHIISVIIGIFVSYIVIVIDSLVQVFGKRTARKRGEEVEP